MVDQNNSINHHNLPDDSEIESLLAGFHPTPSARFYSKMNKAQWNTRNSWENYRNFRAKPLIRNPLLGIFIILLLIFLGITFIPSVNVIARQVFFSFLQAGSDNLDVQVTLTNPGDLFHFSDPANFPLSLQDAQKQAGFLVREIKNPPVDLNFMGSRIDESFKTVTSLYQGDDIKLFITQRPIGKGTDVFSIGASARVKPVNIGIHQGEFVVGGWKAISTQTVTGTPLAGSQTNISAIWDNSLPQYTLRWQDQNFIYELRTIGEGNLSQTALISLANELK
jgi:hypothetical protein